MRDEPLFADSFGYALAMRVLQSDLYPKLDGIERAECDELIRRGQTGDRDDAMRVNATLHPSYTPCATCGKTWGAHVGLLCDYERDSGRRFVKAADELAATTSPNGAQQSSVGVPLARETTREPQPERNGGKA